MQSQQGEVAGSKTVEAPVAIAERFIAARRAGTALPDYPGEQPGTLRDAYAVQDAALGIDGRTVSGWKVGRINPPIGGVDRLSGPVFADQTHPATDEPIAMPVFAEGFAAAEAEFLLRVGAVPEPGKLLYSMDEARALIDAVHVGIEVASSPFPGINDHGPAVTVSDYGNNNGLVIGPALPGWQDRDVTTLSVELFVNDERIGAATAATMLDGPFGAARFLFEHMAARGRPLEPGQWISTGAVTGVHRVAVGDRVQARFDGELTVACTIDAR